MNATSDQPLTLLVDGACPVCRREAGFLRRMDRGRGLVAFVDINAPGFDACAVGLDQGAVHARMHALGPGGEVIEGMEVFRRAYRAVGMGWALAWTAWPGARWLSDTAYRWFARNRLRLFGGAARCDQGACGATGGGA